MARTASKKTEKEPLKVVKYHMIPKYYAAKVAEWPWLTFLGQTPEDVEANVKGEAMRQYKNHFTEVTVEREDSI